MNYDAYGNMVSTPPAQPEPMQYVGQYGYYTDATGFVYVRARYYDPVNGTWISRAGIEYQKAGEHAYGYAENDPVTLVDPAGRDATMRGKRLPCGNSLDPTPQSPPYLLHPTPYLSEESDLLPVTGTGLRECLGSLGFAWFITQGIGRDPESHGYHCPDGRCNGKLYSAAVDLSIVGVTKKRSLTPREKSQFCKMVAALRRCGFAAWFRYNGETNDTTENEIHLIDPAAPCLKDQLITQLRDFVVGGQGSDGYNRKMKRLGIGDPCGSPPTLVDHKALHMRVAAVQPGLLGCCKDPWGFACAPTTF